MEEGAGEPSQGRQEEDPLRLDGDDGTATPVEELEDVPPFAREIVRTLLDQFHREHPHGLPATQTATQQIVREYCAKARRLYDLEQARQDGMPGQPDLAL